MGNGMRRLSDERMFEEVDEVSDEICNPWEIDFLENVSGLAKKNNLSPKQRTVLEKIWERTCESPY